jgi:hypothetical protein
MPLRLTLVLLSLLATANAQENFNGRIGFNISIDASNPTTVEYLEKKYGNLMVMTYDTLGGFMRSFVNSDTAKGLKSELYVDSTGMLKIEYYNKNPFYLDLNGNALFNRHLDSNYKETILGINCNCEIFNAIDKKDSTLVEFLTCFPLNDLMIDPQKYNHHISYYVYYLFKKYRSAYLKFHMRFHTKQGSHAIRYTAKNIQK